LHVGKLVQTDTGAIWTIAKSEVAMVKKSEQGTVFKSDKQFRTDSGFEFGLALSSVKGGEVGVVGLGNFGEVTVKLEATLIIQEERESDVKFSGLTGRKFAGCKVPQLFADTSRGLVVEVRVSCCEQDTAGGAYSVGASSVRAVTAIKNEVAATKGVVAPTKGVVAPTKGVVAPIKGALAPTKGAVAATKGNRPPTKGEVAPTKGERKAEEEESWSLEKALKYMGEETKERVKNSKKVAKKEKRKQKIRDGKINKKGSNPTDDEDSNHEEETAKKEEKQKEKLEKIERRKMKLMMDEEELEGIKTEVSRIREDVGELVDELRKSRRRVEQLRGRLAEEGRSNEAMERDLMGQVAEQEERMRRLEEQLRQEARPAQASPRLLEAATRPVAADIKEEREARVAPSSMNLGAIPKTRVATTKQACSKMPGASLPPTSQAQRSVEKMVRLLEGRGRLASLPTSSLRSLVTKLSARLGGLSDITLAHIEEEVAMMAEEGEAGKVAVEGAN